MSSHFSQYRDGLLAQALLSGGDGQALNDTDQRIYATCRRSGMDGEWPYPHHGQWGATLPLAMCGAVMRANAGLVKG
jgi:hypothetical protein